MHTCEPEGRGHPVKGDDDLGVERSVKARHRISTLQSGLTR